MKMSQFDVNAMSLKELLTLQEQLAIAIPLARAAAKADLLATMEATAAAHGMTLKTLFGTKAARNTRPALKVRLRPPPVKFINRFINPKKASQTWTGRGRRPLWLNRELNKGRALAEFAVRA